MFLSAPFGPSLGSWVMRAGASRVGCLCFASGAVPLEEQLLYLRRLVCNVLVSKPSQVLSLASAAEALKMPQEDFRVRRIITVGARGGSDPAVRQHIGDFWRAEVSDRYGMTEAGSIAGECLAHLGGLHLLDDEFIAEVLEPGSETPVPEGATGELVLTNLGRIGSPLVRYRNVLGNANSDSVEILTGPGIIRGNLVEITGRTHVGIGSDQGDSIIMAHHIIHVKRGGDMDIRFRSWANSQRHVIADNVIQVDVGGKLGLAMDVRGFAATVTGNYFENVTLVVDDKTGTHKPIIIRDNVMENSVVEHKRGNLKI
ncbi:MAG: hypothetical protein NZT92_02630 [Abditibacteriales bacterium]|nr:hypothetical protein [Abditibacteriales bacterium]MDW8366193.1 hypothetical protein [Abditibacteriales bacterium]